MSIKEMNEQEVREAFTQTTPILVKYSAPWCVHCRRIAPTYKALSEENKRDLIFAEVNTDENMSLAESEMIEVIPTFVLYKNGKAVDKVVNPGSKAQLEEFISKNLD